MRWVKISLTGLMAISLLTGCGKLKEFGATLENVDDSLDVAEVRVTEIIPEIKSTPTPTLEVLASPSPISTPTVEVQYIPTLTTSDISSQDSLVWGLNLGLGLAIKSSFFEIANPGMKMVETDTSSEETRLDVFLSPMEAEFKGAGIPTDELLTALGFEKNEDGNWYSLEEEKVSVLGPYSLEKTDNEGEITYAITAVPHGYPTVFMDKEGNLLLGTLREDYSLNEGAHDLWELPLTIAERLGWQGWGDETLIKVELETAYGGEATGRLKFTGQVPDGTVAYYELYINPENTKAKPRVFERIFDSFGKELDLTSEDGLRKLNAAFELKADWPILRLTDSFVQSDVIETFLGQIGTFPIVNYTIPIDDNVYRRRQALGGIFYGFAESSNNKTYPIVGSRPEILPGDQKYFKVAVRVRFTGFRYGAYNHIVKENNEYYEIEKFKPDELLDSPEGEFVRFVEWNRQPDIDCVFLYFDPRPEFATDENNANIVSWWTIFSQK